MPRILWHFKTGDSIVVGDGEADPDDYLDFHPADEVKARAAAALNPVPAPPTKDPNAPLTRKEVIAFLNEGGIAFDKENKVEDLTKLLIDAARSALSGAGRPAPDDASPRAVMALVRAQ